MLINNLISQTTNNITNFYQDVEKLKEDITWQEPDNNLATTKKSPTITKV